MRLDHEWRTGWDQPAVPRPRHLSGECHSGGPAALRPHCDVQSFRNYAGVEEAEITETELSGHLAKEHLASFDTHEELEAFVGGKPVLIKSRPMTKTRNGITKGRMILD